MATNKLDQFGTGWDKVNDLVLFAVVKSSQVVAMKAGNVALQIVTPVYEGGDEVHKTQAILSPDYARKLGASLIEAANMVSKSN